MKKIYCILYILTITSLFVPFKTFWEYSPIEAANILAQNNIIVDTSSTPEAYRLEENLSRREAIKIMMNISGKEIIDSCTGIFWDMWNSDWGCKYGETALRHNMLALNKTFRPDDKLSKIEALKMIFQGSGLEKKEHADWRAWYVESASELGIIPKIFLDYDTSITRQEVFVWWANALKLQNESESSIFYFEYPTDWEYVEDGSISILYWPFQEWDKFQENLAFSYEPLAEWTFQEYRDLSIQNLEDILDITVLSVSDIEINGKKAAEIYIQYNNIDTEQLIYIIEWSENYITIALSFWDIIQEEAMGIFKEIIESIEIQ